MSAAHVTYRAVYDCMHHVGFIAGSGENGYRTNVRSSIKRIRNKFRAVDPSFAEIDNYPSFGYRWGKTQGRRRVAGGETARRLGASLTLKLGRRWSASSSHCRSSCTASSRAPTARCAIW